MSIDRELREELRQVADSMRCPPELYGAVQADGPIKAEDDR